MSAKSSPRVLVVGPGRSDAASRLAAEFAQFNTAATAGAPGAAQPPPDPHCLQFRALADKATLAAVDAKAGRISGVSLLTADREASGHGVWIDQRTLETFEAELKDRRLKAYATHGAWGGDGTLDEVGFWEAVRIEGNQLREDFQALEAWRKHEAAEFDTLFELAEKLPAEFGASLSFRMTLAWVRKDGTELATKRKWREVGMWNYEAYFDPAMPPDAVRDMPSVRCVEVYSADFVSVPAANNGLFRAGPGAPAVDAGGNGNSSPSNQPALVVMNKELFAKFGGNPALLVQAMKLHSENEKLTFAEIVAKVEGDQLAAELTQLRAGAATATAEFGKIEKAGFKAGADGKTAVDVLLAEHAAFKVKADALAAAELALKAAGFEAKDGKTAVELALAANKKQAADILTLRNGGTPAVETGAPAGAELAGKAQLSGIARYEASLKTKLEPQKPGNN